jgi:hypothetical protein
MTDQEWLAPLLKPFRIGEKVWKVRTETHNMDGSLTPNPKYRAVVVEKKMTQHSGHQFPIYRIRNVRTGELTWRPAPFLKRRTF